MRCDATFQTVRLGDLGEFKNGANFSQDDYGPGFPIINVKQLYSGRHASIENLESLKADVLKRPEALFVAQGDILFARSSVKRSGAGQCALVPAGVERTVFSGFIIRFRLTDRSKADPSFLAYALGSPIYREVFQRIATGTTISNLSQAALGSIEISLPPLEYQISTSRVLSLLDDRIDNLRQTNATLEAIAQALFKSWFVDFDPVHAKAEGRAPEAMDTATAALFPSELVDSQVGLIPKGWRTTTLREAFEINPRRSLRKGVPAPYLDMASVPTSGHVPTLPIEREFSSGTKFQNGDTLLARITPCLENGKTAHVDFLEDGQTGWGSTEFIVLQPKAPLTPYFGYLQARQRDFRSFAIQAMTGTSGRQRVELGQLAQFHLVMPNDIVAQAFGQLVEPIRKAISEGASRMGTLAMLRDTLLPRLISGKLRLSEVMEATDEFST